MTSFVHAPLLWGLLLVGGPVLIHLINMLRHRRVRWAAMEFLLFSQKKHRTWILLKQLLLLLLRMGAVAAVVVMLAQPRLGGLWGRLFGSSTTHHIVLLDDSFSMSDSWDHTSALEQAKGVIQQIAQAVAEQGPQRFTLLRFSQAGHGGAGPHPDLFQETVDSRFGQRLAAILDELGPSQTAAGPEAAIMAIDQLLADSPAEDRVVYLVSDFRARDWENPAALRQRLLEWRRADTQIHLIRCVEASRPNLAITDLVCAPGIRAAGVFMFMDVTVHNFAQQPVHEVPVLIEADGRAQPAVTIAQIPPGASVRERFPVRFAAAGQHRLIAQLEPDAIKLDNLRYATVDVPLEQPALLIDGDPLGGEARYLAAALAPGGPATTGVKPDIQLPRYLNNHPLEPFRAIYLLSADWPRESDEPGVAALEQYVAQGGGLALFLGELSHSELLNRRLYRAGKGLLPVPLGAPSELKIDYLQRTPDLEVTPHPVFEVFAGQRNSFLPLVSVQRYYGLASPWKPEAAPDVRVLARLRNGAPLAVERRFGRGKVVAFLTTAAPTWNNWAQNPSFVVAMLELHAYLAAGPADAGPQLVGTPLALALDPGQYEPRVQFTLPQPPARPSRGLAGPRAEAIQGSDAAAPAPRGSGGARPLTIESTYSPDGRLAVLLDQTDSAGFYQALLQRKDGKQETRLYAVNVEAEEGDLRTVWGPDLAARLEDVECRFHLASTFRHAAQEAAASNLGLALMYLLIGLLVAEQLLAYSASYHPSGLGRPRSAGGGP